MKSSMITRGNKRIFNLDKVTVHEWELIGTIRGKQIFHFIIEHDVYGNFEGETVKGNSFVLALKSYPDELYNVTIETTVNTCYMTDASSFK